MKSRNDWRARVRQFIKGFADGITGFEALKLLAALILIAGLFWGTPLSGALSIACALYLIFGQSDLAVDRKGPSSTPQEPP